MKALDKKLILIASIVFATVGAIGRIIAYANTPEHNIPEWVYNIDSLSYALESTSPFLLILGINRYLDEIHTLHPFITFIHEIANYLRIPTAIYSAVSVFDFCKEIAGLNGIHTVNQTFAFVLMIYTTLIVQIKTVKIHASNRTNSNA